MRRRPACGNADFSGLDKKPVVPLCCPFRFPYSPMRFFRSDSIRSILLATLLLGGLLTLSAVRASAQPGGLADDPVKRLRLLGGVIQQQIKQGPINETEFAGYLKELEKIRRELDDPKSKEMGQVLLLAAQIQLDVFEDCDAAGKIAEEFRKIFAEDEELGRLGESLAAQVALCRARDEARKALVGQPAPPIHFDWCSEKGLHSLEQLRGKVVVLDFWANTSQKSVALFPTLRRLQDRFEGLDVAIVGVTHPVGAIVGLRNQPINFAGKPDKELRTLARYRKVKNINWILAACKDPAYLHAYHISRYPTMVIIDPEGRVRHANIGYDVSYLTRAEMIDRLLKEFGKTTSGLVR